MIHSVGTVVTHWSKRLEKGCHEDRKQLEDCIQFLTDVVEFWTETAKQFEVVPHYIKKMILAILTIVKCCHSDERLDTNDVRDARSHLLLACSKNPLGRDGLLAQLALNFTNSQGVRL